MRLPAVCAWIRARVLRSVRSRRSAAAASLASSSSCRRCSTGITPRRSRNSRVSSTCCSTLEVNSPGLTWRFSLRSTPRCLARSINCWRLAGSLLIRFRASLASSSAIRCLGLPPRPVARLLRNSARGPATNSATSIEAWAQARFSSSVAAAKARAFSAPPNWRLRSSSARILASSVRPAAIKAPTFFSMPLLENRAASRSLSNWPIGSLRPSAKALPFSRAASNATPTAVPTTLKAKPNCPPIAPPPMPPSAPPAAAPAPCPKSSGKPPPISPEPMAPLTRLPSSFLRVAAAVCWRFCSLCAARSVWAAVLARAFWRSCSAFNAPGEPEKAMPPRTGEELRRPMRKPSACSALDALLRSCSAFSAARLCAALSAGEPERPTRPLMGSAAPPVRAARVSSWSCFLTKSR